MRKFKQLVGRRSRHYWVLSVFLVFVALTGGGARSDITSLVLLRPAAVIVAGYALWTVTRDQLSDHRWLVWLAAAAVGLTALHLLPLPPEVWRAFPGRGLVSEIDRNAGIGPIWRPLSLAPEATWNALFSLSVPLAAFLIAVQLNQGERRALVPVMLIVTGLTVLMTLSQAVAPSNHALYFYSVTNDGLLVGLFANRNHNAILLACALPLIAAFASMPGTGRLARLRPWLALIGGALVTAIILVVGSRGGVIAALVALLTVPFVYDHSRVSRWAIKRFPAIRPGAIRLIALALVAVGLLGLVGIGLAGSRAVGVSRLMAGGEGEARVTLWQGVTKATSGYFPAGSGAGTFVEAYKVYEPQADLDHVYANHAHNDWLEVAMTAGVPGILLLIAAFAAFAVASWRAWRLMSPTSEGTPLARVGSVVLLLLALTSVTDYPMRVPFIMCLVVIAAIWLRGEPRISRANIDQTA